MAQEPATAQLLPYAAPLSPARGLLLFAVRRMAAGGLRDAYAAHAVFTAFGLFYRRPLLLLRAFMAQVSAVSPRPLTVAPCCCARMTADEAMLLGLLVSGEGARQTEECLFGSPDGNSVAHAAAAVAVAFTDRGLPLL